MNGCDWPDEDLLEICLSRRGDQEHLPDQTKRELTESSGSLATGGTKTAQNITAMVGCKVGDVDDVVKNIDIPIHIVDVYYSYSAVLRY